MNQDIRVDLTGVADIDPSTGTKVRLPRPKPKLPGEESVIESALRLYGELDLPQSGVIKDFVDFKSKPHLRVKTVGTMKLASVKPSTTFTIAFGPSASAGAALTLGLAGGVYGANVPGGGEIGFFGTFNIGVVTNFSVSVVNQGMILFGLPAVVLAGVTIAVGVNVGGKVVTGGGFLVFLDTAPAWTLVGFGFQLGAGASVMPVDFAITKSITAIKPVFKF